MGIRSRLAQIIGGTPDDLPSGEAGSDSISGLAAWALDWATEDKDDHPELSGRARYPIFDSMLVGDPIVAGLMSAISEPIVGTPWTLEPAADTAEARVIADAVAWQLGLGSPVDPKRVYAGQLDVSWRRALRQTLMAVAYGSMTQEIVWADPIEWRDLDGDAHLVRPLARLAPRWPHVLDRYSPAPLGSGLALGSVYQDGIPRPLPGPKLIHLVHRPGVSRYTGSSVLRPAYTIWKLKKQLLVSSAIGYDRHASGTPVIRYPRNGDAKDARRAAEMGRTHRTHERAFYRFPGPKPTDANPDGWDVEILNGAASLADPIPLLRHYDQQIVGAGLANFLQLGTTETGSRAVGQDLSEPYYNALNGLALDVAEDLTRQLVRRWVEANFGVGVEPPRLVPAKIRSRNLESLGRYVSETGDAGVRYDDREAQNALRERADLPPLDDDEVEQPEGAPGRPGPQIDLDEIAGTDAGDGGDGA